MAKDVRAGGAFISLGIVSSIDKGLAAASKKVKRFGANVAKGGAVIAAAGSAVLAPLTAAVFKFADAGDILNKTSLRTGISVEALSELKFAAEQSGASLKFVSDGIFRSFRRIGNAAIAGGGPAARALKVLGLNAKELSQLKADEVLGILADSLNGVGNEAERNQLGFELFGDSFRGMLPLLAAGSAGINALRKEAHELGATMTTEDATAAADFADAWNKIKTVLSSVTMQIGASLAPMLTDMANRVAKIASESVAWLRENRALIVMIAKVAAGAVVFGTAIVALGGFIVAAGAVLGGLAAGIAFLMSPIGLVIAGLGILTAFFFSSFGSMGEIIAWFQGRFGDLTKGVQDSITAITEAISQGDFATAWEIIVESMEMIWLDLTQEIMAVWDTAMDFLTDASIATAKAIGSVFSALGKALVSMLEGFKSIYNGVFNFVTDKIGDLSGVRTIGGPVDAFGGSSIGAKIDREIRNLGANLDTFGRTMGEVAEEQGAQTKRDRTDHAKARTARLDALQGNIGDAADDAKAAKAARDLLLPKIPGLPGAGSLAQAAGGGAAHTSTAGTFSSFGASSLGRRGRSMETQIAENTKATAEATKESADELKKQKGGRFA